MRKNFGSKTWMYPLPVLIVAAYDGEGRPNAMNAGLGTRKKAKYLTSKYLAFYLLGFSPHFPTGAK